MNIKSEDWQEFADKYPSAFSFLAHRDIINEYRDLKAELTYCSMEKMKKWIIYRIEDIEKCCEWVKDEA